MMTKQTVSLILLCLLHFIALRGNMASPILQGTQSSTSFTNQHAVITKETLSIKISSDFTEATYDIRYQVTALKDGLQIPIVFLAEDYKDGFEITVDGESVLAQQLPPQFGMTSSDIEDFQHNFEKNDNQVVVQWTERSGSVYNLSDLKYFQTNLSKGKHTIRIRYTATASIELSEWVRKYSFNYALAPAKHWKRFDTLEVRLDTRAFDQPITTNLGPPVQGDINQQLNWKFDSIPVNTVNITYQPEINTFAKVLIEITPMGIAVAIGILAMLAHVMLMRRKKRTKLRKRTFLIIGSILVPFLFLFVFVLAFGWIDYVIGPEASGRHGYTFFIFILYPLVALLYGLVVSWWSLDSN